jgi:hypothetical protein
MTFSEAFTFSATVGTTELSVSGGASSIQSQTDDGVFELFVDFGVMTSGDKFAVAMYEKVLSGGVQRKLQLGVVTGAQIQPFKSPGFLLLHGWDFSLQKLAGTDRAVTASIRKATGTTISQAFGITPTISTSEFSYVNNSTTIATSTSAGLYQAFFDPVANLAGGDSFVAALREKVRAADSQRKFNLRRLIGAQSQLFVTPGMGLLNGWDFTMQRLAGADRAIAGSIRRVSA